MIDNHGQSVRRGQGMKYKDQLLSTFQHSLEEIVHICPVIRHERTGTLFYSSWIFSYILFVSQERKVPIASPVLTPVSLCKVSRDNSIIQLIVLYLFRVIISFYHCISQETEGGEAELLNENLCHPLRLLRDYWSFVFNISRFLNTVLEQGGPMVDFT